MPLFDCAAILFDLDGVLVDSREAVEHAWREWATSRSLDPERVLAIAHGHRTADTIRIVAPHLSADDEARRLEAAESRHTRGLRKVPGAVELLSRIPPDRWAVFTSGTHVVAEHRLRFAGIALPRVLICAEDVKRGKPDPEGYRTAARKLGVDSADCMVLEDAPTGIEAALAAGARAIGVRGTYSAEELGRAAAVITHFAALEVAVNDDRLHITVPDSPTT